MATRIGSVASWKGVAATRKRNSSPQLCPACSLQSLLLLGWATARSASDLCSTATWKAIVLSKVLYFHDPSGTLPSSIPSRAGPIITCSHNFRPKDSVSPRHNPPTPEAVTN